MYCPKCGNQMPDGSKFCAKCGTAVEQPQASGGAVDPSAASAATGAGPEGAGAPAPKKGRKGLVIGVAAAVVVIVVVLCAVVAASSAVPEPELEAAAPEPTVEAAEPEEPAEPAAAPEPEAAAEPEEEAASSLLPPAWFGVVDSGGYRIVSTDGLTSMPSEADAVIKTAFADGFALGEWETSDYDAEWDQKTNEQTHCGLFDSTGALAVDLTPVLASYGITGQYSMTPAASYASGRLTLWVNPYENGQEELGLALNEKGEVAFTMGRADSTIPNVYLDDAFHDGVLSLYSYDLGEILVGADGAVLVSEQALGEAPESLGYGYYCKYNTRDKVYTYEGSVAFDAASVNSESVTDGEMYYQQPAGAGIVCVEAEKVNPYGGANKRMFGLYSVSTGTWIVPLGGALRGFSEAADGMLWAQRYTSPDGSELGEGAVPDSGESFGDYPVRSAIVNASGETVFDASMAEAGMGIEDDFTAFYLHNGWWGVSNSGSSYPDYLVYIADGAYVGCLRAPASVAFYANSQYCIL